MALTVDLKRIVHAEIVQWEIEEGTFGVKWKLDDGRQGADAIGSAQAAEAIVYAVHGAKVINMTDAIGKKRRGKA